VTTLVDRQLNPSQQDAVAHVTGPLLVLAGAGSGKTRVLTMRIARLIEERGVAPERIFAVTFTNKAAGEMKERVGRLLGRDPAGLWIGTFHSLSARLLRREAELLGFTSRFTIYDETDRLALIRRLLGKLGHSPKNFSPGAVQSIISNAKNRQVPPSELAAEAGFDRLLAVAAEVYADLGPALKGANAMDFDDLLLHPLTLFREHPDRLAAYRDRFAFLLVDEFQDTNRAQYDLIRLMGSHGNVAAVGDDDQSIYGWRGAEVKNMVDFQSDFPTTRLVRLEENYRSSQVVLDTANAVIEQNLDRIGKTLRTTRSGGELVHVTIAADERDEAEWIVRELGRRHRAGDWLYPEMAVLYRTNAQSRALEEGFRRAGTPYRIVGSISFYDRREVKDLLAYLRLIVNPDDDQAFLRAVGVPKRGLGQTSLVRLSDAAERWRMPLLRAAAVADRIIDLRPQAKRALADFAQLLDSLRATVLDMPPAEALEHVIETINYEAVLHAEGPEGADRWDNVKELIASAASWSEVIEEGDPDASPVEQFLADAALMTATDRQQGTEEGVTLMTLHTAKGLEWPVVVLAGLEDGLFPLARAEEQEGGIEEERRLCYVGLTRAKDKLYLTWAKTRRRGGQLHPNRASRFLEAVPPQVVTEERTSSVWSPSRLGDTGRSGGWIGEAWGSGFVASEDTHTGPEDESQDAPRYIKGERVRHRRFGSGVIRGLSGQGKSLKVSVAFEDEDVGVKQLLVAYAGLEREWESA
jgi:DNA helicase-2/ATP-dependent DNA helicase PcrA